MSVDLLLFLAAGCLGGAVNVAAGGAKLFVFPILLSAGLPPLAANATGTVALWPAQVPGIVLFRKSLPAARGALLIDACCVAFGAVLGALALIRLGEDTFVDFIPLFLALAVTAILFGDLLAGWAARLAGSAGGPWLARILFLACGFYAGYFGAGLGFMILAAVILAGGTGLHASNAHKNVLAVAANTAAVIPLSLSGLVEWQAAAAVVLGGLAGGYLGARVVRLLPERPLKWTIALLGTVLTLAYLFKLRA
mgnify:CR=1 FL=1